MDTRSALDEAVAAFAGLLAEDDVAAGWDDPTVLDGYTVGGLACHVVQGVAWLGSVARQGPADDDVRVIAPGGYFATMKREPDPPPSDEHDAIVAMGNDAAGHGCAATRTHLERAAATTSAALAAADLSQAVDLRPLLPFAVPLDAFVATRIVELVVHGDDLAVSLGHEGFDPGPLAYRACADLLTATAAVQHGRTAAVRALSRRERATGEVFPVF